MGNPSCIQINEEADIVEARQSGRNIAKELGFSHLEEVRMTTAISELARNIYAYAPSGAIYIDSVIEPGRSGITVTAKDQGPGIEDIRQVLGDGYSTSGGLGAGLPGVKRLVDDFDIQSTFGEGTEVRITKWLSHKGGLGPLAKSRKEPQTTR